MLARRTLLASAPLLAAASSKLLAAVPGKATWTRLVDAAPFPPSYNFPVHVDAMGRFVALHPKGTWVSRDGKVWEKSPLPFSGMNSAYLPYVLHNGETWALGGLEGNYLSFRVDPVIQLTQNHARWETKGRSASLPRVVFHAAASFRGRLWILGGFDGRHHSAEVWSSSDGLAWSRVATAPWSPRAGSRAIVFRERLFLIGGGIIDGANANDVWSTADGVGWQRETGRIAPEEPVGFTPVVHDDAVWLVGANRSGRFRSEMLVSADGRVWTPERAPWSPRGGVAAWSADGALYVTGGKYSYETGGETRFVYSNDVWRMTRGA